MKKDGLQIAQCVGGTSVSEVRQQLQRGVHVVVGTPGRVGHMISSKSLDLSSLKAFVLDEAFYIFYFS